MQWVWVIRLLNLDLIGRMLARKADANVLILSGSCRIPLEKYKASFYPEIFEEDMIKFGL